MDQEGILGMKRLLLIDSSEAYRAAWSSLFGDRGVEVVAAKDGSEGLISWFEGCPFDAVVVDLYLPGNDGIAVIETISAQAAIPVIAVAEARRSGIDLLPAATVLGATRSYRKPISSEFLWRELCSLTGEAIDILTDQQVVSGGSALVEVNSLQ